MECRRRSGLCVLLIAEGLIAEGDEAVVRATVWATHHGEFKGIPATGRSINVPGNIIERIAAEDCRALDADRYGALMQLLGMQA